MPIRGVFLSCKQHRLYFWNQTIIVLPTQNNRTWVEQAKIKGAGGCFETATSASLVPFVYCCDKQVAKRRTHRLWYATALLTGCGGWYPRQIPVDTDPVPRQDRYFVKMQQTEGACSESAH